MLACRCGSLFCWHDRSAQLRRGLSPLPGRCFRLVSRHGDAGPTHCPEPVAWRGSWRAPNGRRYRIEACEGHRPAPDEGSGPAA
jgi:hypothetical protein